jgi:DNA primase
LLYGYHRTAAAGRDPLVVVECPWGVMRLAQLGIHAVALLGTQASVTQMALLTDCRHVVLLLDGDDAGQRAATAIATAYGGTLALRIGRLPPGCDPDDLSNDALHALLAPLLL